MPGAMILVKQMRFSDVILLFSAVHNSAPKIEAVLFKGKVVILYGARQVGKTTLIKEIL
ncbi:MAG: hypothetical protein Q7K39_04810 [Candidatus Magasanikbacteria bacterium]|nr:hypothetical protein [Candidatus Magasanikbacteria bacterium]